MFLRMYNTSDCEYLAELFYQIVHNVNAKDYTKEQLDVWPIVCEMIKTAIENKQNLIIEGCYIPFDWSKDIMKEYLDNIRYYCLVMSEDYIRNHFADIKRYASVIENRLDDKCCTLENVLNDNSHILELAINHNVNYVLIDDKYEIDINL